MNEIIISVNPYIANAEATVQTVINGWDVHTVMNWILELKDKLGERYHAETLRIFECFSDIIVSGEPEAVFAIVSVISRFVSKYGDDDFKKPEGSPE